MTNEELTAIEEKSGVTMYRYDLWEEVPALVAEVRKLRAERDALRKVDDAMVERAVEAYDDEALKSDTTSLCCFIAIRAALDAALAVQP